MVRPHVRRGCAWPQRGGLALRQARQEGNNAAPPQQGGGAAAASATNVPSCLDTATTRGATQRRKPAAVTLPTDAQRSPEPQRPSGHQMVPHRATSTGSAIKASPALNSAEVPVSAPAYSCERFVSSSRIARSSTYALAARLQGLCRPPPSVSLVVPTHLGHTLRCQSQGAATGDQPAATAHRLRLELASSRRARRSDVRLPAFTPTYSFRL